MRTSSSCAYRDKLRFVQNGFLAIFSIVRRLRECMLAADGLKRPTSVFWVAGASEADWRIRNIVRTWLSVCSYEAILQSLECFA